MARVPKCFGCKHFDIEKMTCIFFIDGYIPKDVMNELKSCKHYQIANDEEDDEDLPVATGR